MNVSGTTADVNKIALIQSAPMYVLVVLAIYPVRGEKTN